MWIFTTRNRNRNLQTSKAPLKSQKQGISLFMTAEYLGNHSVCLSLCLCMCDTVCPTVCVSFSVYVCLSVCMRTCMSINLSIK